MKKDAQENHTESRRSFLKKAGYVAPAVLTLPVTPALAQYASNEPVDEGSGKDKDKKDKNK